MFFAEDFSIIHLNGILTGGNRIAKKKKRRIQAPSLSALDKGIYFCLIACFIVAGLFLYPAIIGNFRRSVFKDIHILAQGNPSIVILGFFGMFIGGGFALAFDWLRRKKQPIFGKTNIKNGPPLCNLVGPATKGMLT